MGLVTNLYGSSCFYLGNDVKFTTGENGEKLKKYYVPY